MPASRWSDLEDPRSSDPPTVASPMSAPATYAVGSVKRCPACRARTLTLLHTRAWYCHNTRCGSPRRLARALGRLDYKTRNSALFIRPVRRVRPATEAR